MKHYHKHKIGFVLLFITMPAAAAAVVMLLWNALIPAIVGWGSVTYWQALGLIILCRLLFGGMPRGGHRGHGGIARLKEKLHGMSREERRELILRRMHRLYHEEEERPVEP
jgi:hypothetical protein